MASLLNSFGLGGGSSSSSSTEKKGASFATVFDTTPLPAAVQTHVQSVYALLAMTVAMSAVGAAAHAQYGLGNNPLAQIAVFGLAILIAMTGDPAGVNLVSRASQLGAFGFFQGVCIGPLVALAATVNAHLLITAFLGTTVIFACFALFAALSPRRSLLYLGSTASSALMVLMVVQFGSAFGLVSVAANVAIQLYAGLGVFCVYVIYDTQVMIERAASGSKDLVADAMQLYLDFIAIFVRILIILLENAKKDEKKKSNNRR